ncbi:magnesium-dependent phosphatase-1 [Mycena haematopus]|nr:magnesium-dependent phosphatase-1 [Mycena haematopus]
MFPKLIAFDLDYTLWDLWIDTHVTGPLRQSGDAVVDAHGVPVEFYADVPGILRQLRDGRNPCGLLSYSRPEYALQLLRVAGDDEEPAKPAIQLFDNLQIYPGSKLTHFRALHAKTGIPYEHMLFFDDERRNREVEGLGVVFHLTPTGIDNATIRCWNSGMEGAHF